MSKKKNMRSSVYEYFTVTTDERHYLCQCKNLKHSIEGEAKVCGQQISTFRGSEKNAPTRSSNLIRHLLHFHPEILDKVKEKDAVFSEKKETSGPSISKSGQSNLSSFFTMDKITIAMTADTFKKHLIDLVVQNGVSEYIFTTCIPRT